VVGFGVAELSVSSSGLRRPMQQDWYGIVTSSWCSDRLTNVIHSDCTVAGLYDRTTRAPVCLQGGPITRDSRAHHPARKSRRRPTVATLATDRWKMYLNHYVNDDWWRLRRGGGTTNGRCRQQALHGSRANHWVSASQSDRRYTVLQNWSRRRSRLVKQISVALIRVSASLVSHSEPCAPWTRCSLFTYYSIFSRRKLRFLVDRATRSANYHAKLSHVMWVRVMSEGQFLNCIYPKVKLHDHMLWCFASLIRLTSVVDNTVVRYSTTGYGSFLPTRLSVVRSFQLLYLLITV